jgi:hypothetical protein
LCNLGVCGPGVFQNWLKSLWLIWSLDVHLSMYVNLDWAHLNSWFLCSLLMYVCRLCTCWDPVKLVWCNMGHMHPGDVDGFV